MVFSSVGANQYQVALVTRNFTQGAPLSSLQQARARFASLQKAQLTPMENHECIATYSSQFQSFHRSVLLIVNENDLNERVRNGSVRVTHPPILWMAFSSPEFMPSYSWICSQQGGTDEYQFCDITRTRNNASTWEVRGIRIDGCLVERSPPVKCRLNFNSSLLIVVIIANAFKLGAMGVTLWKFNEPRLVTIGDAVASFLDRPDENFKGRCLASGPDLKKLLRIGEFQREGLRPSPRIYRLKDYPTTWFSSSSRQAWNFAPLV